MLGDGKLQSCPKDPAPPAITGEGFNKIKAKHEIGLVCYVEAVAMNAEFWKEDSDIDVDLILKHAICKVCSIQFVIP